MVNRARSPRRREELRQHFSLVALGGVVGLMVSYIFLAVYRGIGPMVEDPAHRGEYRYGLGMIILMMILSLSVIIFGLYGRLKNRR